MQATLPGSVSEATDLSADSYCARCKNNNKLQKHTDKAIDDEAIHQQKHDKDAHSNQT